MFIWHICAKVTFTKQTKGSKVGFTHVEGSDLGHALMTWPKLLNFQLMFLNCNSILEMPKNNFSLLNFSTWTMSKKFWHSRNEIGFPKHQLLTLHTSKIIFHTLLGPKFSHTVPVFSCWRKQKSAETHGFGVKYLILAQLYDDHSTVNVKPFVNHS